MNSSGAPAFSSASAMASKVGPAAPFPALTRTFMGVSAETSTNSISFAT
jgi:hypothetical protein